jgi:hypothetical protein
MTASRFALVLVAALSNHSGRISAAGSALTPAASPEWAESEVRRRQLRIGGFERLDISCTLRIIEGTAAWRKPGGIFIASSVAAMQTEAAQRLDRLWQKSGKIGPRRTFR